MKVGLHQGLALSPFLFAIVVDSLVDELRQETPRTMMFGYDIVTKVGEFKYFGSTVQSNWGVF